MSSSKTVNKEREEVKSLTGRVKVRSSDDVLFEVQVQLASQSLTIKAMVEDFMDGGTSDFVIPLPNVSSRVLAKVLEFCYYNYHQHRRATPPSTSARPTPYANMQPTPPLPSEEDLKHWNAQFFDNLDKNGLFELILAANYLNIQSLLDLACQYVADMIRHKSPEEIRELFGIVNDFTPEEEAKVRRKNQWAFK